MFLIPNNIPMFLGVFIGANLLASVYKAHRGVDKSTNNNIGDALVILGKMTKQCSEMYNSESPRGKLFGYVCITGLAACGIGLAMLLASTELLLTAGIYNAFANPSAPTAVLGICCAAIKMCDVVYRVNSEMKKNSQAIA